MGLLVKLNLPIEASAEDFWTSGYLEITLAIILAIIVIVFLILVYFSYHQIIVPEPFYRNGVSSHYSGVDIVQQYLAFKGVHDVGVQKQIVHSHPFGNYRNNTITINDLPLFHQTYQLTGIGLDYILGRSFIALQQHLHESDYLIYRLVGFVLPAFCFGFFWLFFLLNIVFGAICQSLGNLVLDNSVMYVLFHFKIFLIIMVICWGLYFICIVFSYHVKLSMENDYESDIRSFVKAKYLDLYSDFLIARRYSRSVKITYSVGIGWLLKHDYRYLGPFGYF